MCRFRPLAHPLLSAGVVRLSPYRTPHEEPPSKVNEPSVALVVACVLLIGLAVALEARKPKSFDDSAPANTSGLQPIHGWY
jgi:hypothetical protein